MSPTRREFIATAAASSVALSVALPLAAHAQADTEQQVVAPASPGLPPTQIARPAVCSECQAALGTLLMDELDHPNFIVCRQCFEDAEDEAKDEAADPGELEEQSDRIGELENQVEDLKPIVAEYQQLSERTRWLAYDLASHPALPDDLRRLAERLHEQLVGVATSKLQLDLTT